MDSMQTQTQTNAIGNAINAGNVHSDATHNQDIVFLECSQLRETPMGNYRKCRNAQDYKDLVESVEAKGFLQNIVIRRSPIDGMPEVVAGYGRWQVAKDLTEKHKDTGRKFILPCLDMGVIGDQECLELALTENSKRSNHTISDQIELAREYYGINVGDLKLSAIKLGISEGVFRELLHLGACCEPLLNALDDPDSPLQKGHCSILRNFPESIQLDTLARIIAEPKTYTIAYLKKQAASFEFSLKDAKFDTADCSSCQHNSGGAHCFLFADDEEDNKCSNPPCYVNKQKLWLATTLIPQLEEKHGTVLTTEQKPLEQIRFCAPEMLGEEQVNDCKNCSDCVVLVDTSPDKFGDAWGGVCINLTCHSKLEAKYKADIAITDVTDVPTLTDAPSETNADTEVVKATAGQPASQSPAKPASQPPATPASQPPATPAAKPAGSTAKLTKKLQRTYANMVQKAFIPTVSANQNVALAFIAKSLSNAMRGSQVKETIEQLSKKPTEDINLMIQSLVGEFFCQDVKLDSDAFDSSGFNANEIVRKSFDTLITNDEEKEKIIRDSWIPTKELLSNFTIDQLGLIASQSEFDKAFSEDKKSDTAWSKVMKSGKDKVISNMLSVNFDWTDYAPKSYIQIGMTYSKPA